MLRAITDRIFRSCVESMAVLPVLDVIPSASNGVSTAGSSIDIKDMTTLLMAAPKRNKSKKMKQFEHNRPWLIPKDLPYVPCSTCGSPRVKYCMCEICYDKVKEQTLEMQKPLIEEVRRMRLMHQSKKHAEAYVPKTYEERLQPLLDTHTLQRLKPQPVTPVDEAWKENLDGYEEWYLEGGKKVERANSDEDVEILTETSDSSVPDTTK